DQASAAQEGLPNLQRSPGPRPLLRRRRRNSMPSRHNNCLALEVSRPTFLALELLLRPLPSSRSLSSRPNLLSLHSLHHFRRAQPVRQRQLPIGHLAALLLSHLCLALGLLWQVQQWGNHHLLRPLEIWLAL